MVAVKVRRPDILDKLKQEHEEAKELLETIAEGDTGAERKAALKKLKTALIPAQGPGSRLEAASWDLMRWVAPDTDLTAAEAALPSGGKLAYDQKEQPVILFPTEWALNYFVKKNPELRIADVPFTFKEGEAPVEVA